MASLYSDLRGRANLEAMAASRRHEFIAGVALQEEKRGQVAVVDAKRCGLGDDGLGMECDAHAGGVDHAKVVGPVAHGDCIRRIGGECHQRLDFGLAPKDAPSSSSSSSEIR